MDQIQKWLKGYLDALNAALKFCRDKGWGSAPDASIVSNDQNHPIDTSSIKDNPTGTGLGDVIGKVANGGNKRCIKILITNSGLGPGHTGEGAAGIGLSLAPTPGDPPYYNKLPHECGHVAGYDCGDEDEEHGGKAHNKDKGNIMYPGYPGLDQANQSPDPCWCKAMTDLDKKK